MSLTFDATSAECHVFTFKEGLLSRVAHDLKLRVGRFTIEADLEEGDVSATFDPESLRVVCARRDGQDAPELLSESQHDEIYGYMQRDVLESHKHREIRFESDFAELEDDTAIIYGTLTLHGVKKSLSVSVRRTGAQWLAEVPIHQPDFGIKPYTALLGTLKIKPEIVVQLAIPAA